MLGLGGFAGTPLPSRQRGEKVSGSLVGLLFDSGEPICSLAGMGMSPYCLALTATLSCPLSLDVSLQSSLPLVHSQGQLPPQNNVLDYLESEIQNLNLSQPLLPSHHFGTNQHPSVLSSLSSEIVERRVIQLPPITELIPSSQRSTSLSQLQRAGHAAESWGSTIEDEREDRRRCQPLNGDSLSSFDQESWDKGRDQPPQRQREGSYEGRHRSSRRDVSPTHRPDHGRYGGICYPEEAREHSGRRFNPRQQPLERQRYQSSNRKGSNSEQRGRQHRSYSPPSWRESWSSAEEHSRFQGNNRQRHRRSPGWPEDKPPSYRSLEIIPAKDSKHRSSVGQQSVSQSSSLLSLMGTVSPSVCGRMGVKCALEPDVCQGGWGLSAKCPTQLG